MTRLCLVRHGLTEFNRLKKLQGASDIPLNEEGEYQARRAADKLREEQFDAIVSSPLGRAYRTAEIINEYHNLPIETMNELKEQHFGELEGHHIDDIMEKYPHGELPGAETFEALAERVQIALDHILEHHRNQYVLVTAHSRTIKSILSLFSKEIDMLGTKLDNCSVSYIEYVDSKWQVHEYNIPTYTGNEQI